MGEIYICIYIYIHTLNLSKLNFSKFHIAKSMLFTYKTTKCYKFTDSLN